LSIVDRGIFSQIARDFKREFSQITRGTVDNFSRITRKMIAGNGCSCGSQPPESIKKGFMKY